MCSVSRLEFISVVGASVLKNIKWIEVWAVNAELLLSSYAVLA